MTNNLEKIIKCTNIDFPRIDGKGACTGITLGQQYTVISGNKQYMYRIVNDLGENAYYLKVRFENVPPKVYKVGMYCLVS
jgi:hypothetical protein